MTMRQLIDEARQSAERIGVDDPIEPPTQLADEIIRIARVATSIHLAETARLAADADRRRRTDPTPTTRESVR